MGNDSSKEAPPPTQQQPNSNPAQPDTSASAAAAGAPVAKEAPLQLPPEATTGAAKQEEAKQGVGGLSPGGKVATKIARKNTRGFHGGKGNGRKGKGKKAQQAGADGQERLLGAAQSSERLPVLGSTATSPPVQQPPPPPARPGSGKTVTEADDNVSTVKPPRTHITCPGHTKAVFDLCFSHETPDNKGIYLMSGGHDKVAMLRHGASGDWVGSFQGCRGAVWSVCLDKWATLAATGSAEFSAKLWDATTGEELYEFDHPAVVKTVHFNGDATRLLTGSGDKIRVFDCSHTGASAPLLKSPKLAKQIKKARFSPADDNIVLGILREGNQLLTWDIRQGFATPATTITLDLPTVDLDVAFDSAAAKAITVATANARGGGEVLLFDASVAIPSLSRTLKCGGEGFAPLTTASLSPNATLTTNGEAGVVATGEGGALNVVRLWDVKSGKELGQQSLADHYMPVTCTRFSPRGDTIASGGEDGLVHLWDLDLAVNPSNQ